MARCVLLLSWPFWGDIGKQLKWYWMLLNVRIPALCDLWNLHSAYKPTRSCGILPSECTAEDLAKTQENSCMDLCFLLCIAPSSLAPCLAHFYCLPTSLPANPIFIFYFSVRQFESVPTTKASVRVKLTLHVLFLSKITVPCFILCNAWSFLLHISVLFIIISCRSVNLIPITTLWLNFHRTTGSQPLFFLMPFSCVNVIQGTYASCY